MEDWHMPRKGGAKKAPAKRKAAAKKAKAPTKLPSLAGKAPKAKPAPKKKAAAPSPKGKAPAKKAPAKKPVAKKKSNGPDASVIRTYRGTIMAGILGNVRGDYREFDEFEAVLEAYLRMAMAERKKHTSASGLAEVDMVACWILMGILLCPKTVPDLWEEMGAEHCRMAFEWARKAEKIGA
jgi:hypothetical protein